MSAEAAARRTLFSTFRARSDRACVVKLDREVGRCRWLSVTAERTLECREQASRVRWRTQEMSRLAQACQIVCRNQGDVRPIPTRNDHRLLRTNNFVEHFGEVLANVRVGHGWHGCLRIYVQVYCTDSTSRGQAWFRFPFSLSPAAQPRRMYARASTPCQSTLRDVGTIHVSRACNSGDGLLPSFERPLTLPQESRTKT